MPLFLDNFLSLSWLCCLCIVFFVLFLWCFFRICCSGVCDCGFLGCKVGIDKSVSVAFTDGVCLWYGWCLCMDGSVIFLGLDCAFW